MDWTIQDFGAAGEFVAAIAVLVTLIYLAAQVRHTKATITEQARSARLESTTQLLAFNAGDTVYARAYAKMLEKEGVESDSTIHQFISKYDLDAEEAIRMLNWCFLWLKTREAIFLQPLDTDERIVQDRMIQGWMKFPYASLFWNAENEAWFDDRFVLHVNGLIKNAK